VRCCFEAMLVQFKYEAPSLDVTEESSSVKELMAFLLQPPLLLQVFGTVPMSLLRQRARELSELFKFDNLGIRGSAVQVLIEAKGLGMTLDAAVANLRERHLLWRDEKVEESWKCRGPGSLPGWLILTPRGLCFVAEFWPRSQLKITTLRVSHRRILSVAHIPAGGKIGGRNMHRLAIFYGRQDTEEEAVPGEMSDGDEWQGDDLDVDSDDDEGPLDASVDDTEQELLDESGQDSQQMDEVDELTQKLRALASGKAKTLAVDSGDTIRRRARQRSKATKQRWGCLIFTDFDAGGVPRVGRRIVEVAKPKAAVLDGTDHQIDVGGSKNLNLVEGLHEGICVAQLHSHEDDHHASDHSDNSIGSSHSQVSVVQAQQLRIHRRALRFRIQGQGRHKQYLVEAFAGRVGFVARWISALF